MALEDNASLLAQLYNIIQSPRVRRMGNSTKKATSQVSGPFSGGMPKGISNILSQGGPKFGASPNFGNSIRNMTDLVSRLPKGASQQPQQQVDPLMALYNQLVNQLQQPVDMPGAVDKEDLMRQVQDAINPIYDQRIGQAKNETSRATKDVQGMYGALSNEYKKLAPEQRAQSAEMQKQIEGLYGQLRTNIQGDFARVSNEQGELFKQLGIEDALPDVLDDQSDQVQDSLVAASENQAQQQQRYADIGNMDETYYREGAPQAVMRGNEISTDLISQLQEYINQANAERTAGIQSGYMDQLGQANNQLMQQQQMAQSESGRRQEMLFQMLNQAMQQPKQQELTPDSFMGQLPPEMQQSVAGAYTKLQRSPEAIYGKTVDPRNPVPQSFVDTTPEWYLAQADEMLKRGEIDATQHQALLMYIQLMMSK